MTTVVAGRLPTAEWLRRRPLADVLAMLDRDGEEARVVGGAVRNALLGEPLGDVDIATTAVPDEVSRRARAAGFRPVPTGIAHGTVTVVVAGAPFEVTTLREDVETFGRKATVAFGRDWRADAARRDFTMNALSVSPDGTLHDPVDGIGDLEARRVRFIGDPAIRIAEDHLRVLRFFRFHAAYGRGGLDADGLAACVRARDTLSALSRERVRMEVMKLLVAPGAPATLAAMAETGLLQRVLGGVGLVASLARLATCETALGLAPDPVRRLAALAVSVSEDADRLRERLRLTNAEHKRLLAAADGWWRLSPTNEAAAREALYRAGEETFRDRALLAWSRARAPDDAAWTALAALPSRWPAPSFPIRAADLTARGIVAGPTLGQALREAEAAWIAAGFPMDESDTEAVVAGVVARVVAQPTDEPR